MKLRKTQLRVEPLEDRCTPATWGNPWPDAAHLTLSFAPDGTSVGDNVSDLFRLLNAVATTGTWQREMLRAFQTWAVNANINLSFVADQGLALGATGAIQGDARFGDIRLAAYPFPFDAPATTSPFQLDAGTWSGDVTLNSAARLGINAADGNDLFSVLLHEAGHVFGLDHSSDADSCLFDDYLGVRTGLTAEDIRRLQAIYGVRTPDSYEGTVGNDQLSSATLLGTFLGLTPSTVIADVTTLQDRDVYSFQSLLGIGGAVIQVRTTGVSLLTPRVSILDSSGHTVASAVSVDPMQGGLTIRLSNLRALSTYYVKIESAQQDVFGIGGYQLSVTPLPLVNGLLGGVTSIVSYGLGAVTNVLLNNDLHTNDSFLTALNLTQSITQSDSRFDYGFRGSISDSMDVDYYQVHAPAAPAGTQLVLNAMIWGLQDNGLDPRVRVFDMNHNPVSAEVLVNDTYSFTIQVRDAAPQATFFVQVLPAASQSNQTGNYYLGVDFGMVALNMEQFVAATLDANHPSVTVTMTLTKNRLFHFVLAAQAHNATARATVVMTICNAAGQVVFSLAGSTVEAVSGNVYLKQGSYTAHFSASGPNGTPPPALDCKLAGTILNDPIGPEPVDPTSDPAGSPNNEPPPPPPPGDGGTTWGIPTSDPSSDPYSTTSSSNEGDASGSPIADDETINGDSAP